MTSAWHGHDRSTNMTIMRRAHAHAHTHTLTHTHTHTRTHTETHHTHTHTHTHTNTSHKENEVLTKQSTRFFFLNRKVNSVSFCEHPQISSGSSRERERFSLGAKVARYSSLFPLSCYQTQSAFLLMPH